MGCPPMTPEEANAIIRRAQEVTGAAMLAYLAEHAPEPQRQRPARRIVASAAPAAAPVALDDSRFHDVIADLAGPRRPTPGQYAMVLGAVLVLAWVLR